MIQILTFLVKNKFVGGFVSVFSFLEQKYIVKTGDDMCDKEEVQKKNEEKLQEMFPKDGTPDFIQRLFINFR